MGIELANISKSFGPFTALRDVSLTVGAGELLALLGPSGCGKTTLLRVIAGLEEPDPGSGPIRFHREDVAGRDVGKRQVGFVFQHYALFRHMTVAQNIAFGLDVRPRRTRPSSAEIRERVDRLVRLIQLENMADRYPHQLSGGQRQRVALARALAIEPRILLLDEPFGALDAKVRQELRLWLRRLHDELHVTTVFVTHDQEEALELSDRVVVMNKGRIEQDGTPHDVFHRPATAFVMDFLGQVNLFHGRVEDGKVRFASVALEAQGDHGGAEPVKVFVRPHDLEVAPEPLGPESFAARVVRVHSAGPAVRLDLVAESGETLMAELSHRRHEELGIAAGAGVFVRPREVRVFGSGEEPAAA